MSHVGGSDLSFVKSGMLELLILIILYTAVQKRTRGKQDKPKDLCWT